MAENGQPQLRPGSADSATAKPTQVSMLFEVTEIKKLEKAYQAVSVAIESLRNDPADPQANLIAGRYYCFIKNDFESGLPLLARCSEEQFSLVAKKDQAAPTSSERQVELAGNWLDFLESNHDENIKAGSSDRAAYWYRQALPQLAGIEKAEVEKKLEAIGEKASDRGKVVDGNVALASAGAKVHGMFYTRGGSIAGGEVLIDGKASSADGYGIARLPSTWIVELQEAFPLRQIRMRLLGSNNVDRFYRYVIETSVDGEKFTPLINRLDGEWRSWQVVDFPPQAARYIRIRGLHNSKSGYFDVIEFEAYCKPNRNPPAK